MCVLLHSSKIMSPQKILNLSVQTLLRQLLCYIRVIYFIHNVDLLPLSLHYTHNILSLGRNTHHQSGQCVFITWLVFSVGSLFHCRILCVSMKTQTINGSWCSAKSLCYSYSDGNACGVWSTFSWLRLIVDVKTLSLQLVYICGYVL